MPALRRPSDSGRLRARRVLAKPGINSIALSLYFGVCQ